MPADRDFVASTTARLREAGRRSGATEFGRWWSGELAALMPEATRSAAKRRRMRPVIAFADDAATFWQPSPRGTEIGMDRVARVPLGDDDAGRAAIDALVRSARTPRVVIAIAPQHVLRRTLVLPDAIEENLRQAIAYDLDRHTPFRPEDLYFDAAVTGRDPAHAQLQVELATVRRAVVDHAVDSVERWGGHVVAVVPESPDAAAASKLNLLPADRQPAKGGWRWRFWIPLAVLGAIAAVAIALPIWQMREQAIALLRQADEARGQAAVSEALRSELDRLVDTHNFALERKFTFPPAVQVVDEVTKLLPDDTWLTQLEVKTAVRGKDAQRELLLRGESGNAGRLITLFEESKVFTQAAPRSPTTKIQPGPGEIFDLVAQLRPLPPPQPVPLGSESAIGNGKPPVAETAQSPEATPQASVAATPSASVATPPAKAPPILPAASSAPSARPGPGLPAPAAAPASAPGAPSTAPAVSVPAPSAEGNGAAKPLLAVPGPDDTRAAEQRNPRL